MDLLRDKTWKLHTSFPLKQCGKNGLGVQLNIDVSVIRDGKIEWVTSNFFPYLKNVFSVFNVASTNIYAKGKNFCFVYCYMPWN